MGDKLRSLLTWLLRIDKQQDPLLEEYLQRNRESLESQRIDFGELPEQAVEETVSEESIDEWTDTPEVVEEKPRVYPDPSQSELPLEYQDAPPRYEISEVEIQDSAEIKEKRRANKSK